MSEFIIEKEKTCAFSGHRNLNNALFNEGLKEQIIKLINKGYNCFLVGMAIGFDTECAKIILSLKNQFNIKLVACIPCLNQDKSFNESQKKEYREILSKTDKTIYVSKEYTPYCMMKRNMFMVDNSSVLVCYLRQIKGGTKNTVEYAEKQGLQIIKV